MLNVRDFEVQLSHDEFQNLVEIKIVKEKVRGKIVNKKRMVFKKFEWQLPLTKKIREAVGLSCGLHFKSHKIMPSLNQGEFLAYCDCGSTLEGQIKDIEKPIVRIACHFIKGTGGTCGKTYIRANHRSGKSISKKSSSI